MIYALATPMGKAALAVFRISGDGCHALINTVLDKDIRAFNKICLRR
ncbi:MAG: hypothetical protein CM15mP12_4210 [Gammaproteobacteria bacterium]|nr:MAG: hypothetical protein CM15mP12_4210 [Gammaproteobacteria bacterium]